MRQQEGFFSPLLEQQVDYLRFGRAGRPVVLFPTSGGRYWEVEERSLVGALSAPVAEGRLQLYCVDSINRISWNDNALPMYERVRRNDLFDRHLAGELLPRIAAEAGRGDLVLYGASFGAFHAVNFAARHPEQVSKVVGFSGFYDLHRVLEGYWDDLCYFHSPAAYVANMGPDWIQRLSRVEWILATGQGDSLVEETRQFAQVLRQKSIPVHCEIWPGVFGHDWPFWKEHLPRFLP